MLTPHRVLKTKPRSSSTRRSGARRWWSCHSAAPPSHFSRRFNSDDEGVSAKWQPRRRLSGPSPSAALPLRWHPLSIPIETPAPGRGGCSRTPVSLAVLPVRWHHTPPPLMTSVHTGTRAGKGCQRRDSGARVGRGRNRSGTGFILSTRRAPPRRARR